MFLGLVTACQTEEIETDKIEKEEVLLNEDLNQARDMIDQLAGSLTEEKTDSLEKKPITLS